MCTLLQEGIVYLVPYITKRKLQVSVQDMCNLLEGGLVSYVTLSDHLIEQLSTLSTGAAVCMYTYQPTDIINSQSTSSISTTSSLPPVSYYVVVWKGKSRTINVMANKIDLETIKSQFQITGIYR